MFNAWLFNGSPYAGSSNSVRVIFAGAAFAVAASADPIAWRITHSEPQEAHWLSTTQANAIVDYAGSAEGYVNAYVDRTRPIDLVELELEAKTKATVSSYSYRAAESDLVGWSGLDQPKSIVYAFYADFDGHTDKTATPTRWVFPSADFSIHAESSGEATRKQKAKAEAKVFAETTVAAPSLIVSGKPKYFSSELDFRTYTVLNGTHYSVVNICSKSDTEFEGVRWAGGFADADVYSTKDAEKLVFRGAVAHADVNAAIDANWWVYRHLTVKIPRGIPSSVNASGWSYNGNMFSTGSRSVSMDIRISRFSANGFKIAEGKSNIDTEATTYAKWSRKVWPSTQFVSSIGLVDVDALRIRHEEVTLPVLGEVTNIHARLALRPTIEIDSTATIDPTAWRTTFSETDVQGYGSISRARASVNLLNPAPVWRQMIVPEEDRTMIVEGENRTMKVA